jgi:methionyl aminopeptidase
MTVENDKDIEGLLRIGQICGLALKHMHAHVEPGMTTAELDAIGAAFLKQHGARSAPILAYKFPGYTCISLNDEAAHGIPGERVIQPGDLINIDVSAELEGYWADTGASAIVPPSRPEYEDLLAQTRTALDEALNVARAGQPINAIGKAVETVARKAGYRVIRELCGHGVGRHIHEPPQVPNYYDRNTGGQLSPGMVFTIEPFFSPGYARIITAQDGWTLKTFDGQVVAQFEHTVIITDDQPILATAV